MRMTTRQEAAYNHALYLPQRVHMMQWWADYLDTGFNKEKDKDVATRKTK